MMKEQMKLSLIIKCKKTNYTNIGEIIQKETGLKLKKVEINSKMYANKDIFDVWEYAVKFTDAFKIENTILEFLEDIKLTVQLANNAFEGYEFFLKLYLQSDYAQIRYSLSHEVLMRLAEMKIKFDFSILSWGGAKT